MNDKFDQALSRRLSKLSTLPVDTSHLDRALRAQVGEPSQPAQWRRKLQSFSAVAASLILIALVTLALFQNRTAQASPEAMLQFHRDVVSGKVATMQVDSVEELNKAFDAFGTNGVRVSTLPEMKGMSCCVKDVADKRVTCILLKDNSGPVTLSIAESKAFKPLNTSPVMHNGEAFHVQTTSDLTMVTVDRGIHRVCLIGPQPAEKLMSLADGLHF